MANKQVWHLDGEGKFFSSQSLLLRYMYRSMDKTHQVLRCTRSQGYKTFLSVTYTTIRHEWDCHSRENELDRMGWNEIQP